MTDECTNSTGQRTWVVATCGALVLAAVGDAGPEIVESRGLLAGHDGPGPLIYLGVAVLLAAVRWRFVPLVAVAMSVLFLVGGFADAAFRSRLTGPVGAGFAGGWLQMLSFGAAIVCGTAAVRRQTTRRRPQPVRGDW
ncbi:hypothetical protein [Actinoplanes derwentensis]|uniref:Uncharacterized protein n=1 Tax=Actinoplanes derwentensis TaxID=113562 RepID=A0A1H2D601_9ACTN|nr:hypothetical protein [Actinoplanes derwentensis]GID85629.1 hypothetical protein Ade03nite_45530 [Actinoplanes derwentensis]SDT78170.1 hypothetical protein SAMN04489716_8262 [Actinoplanes derwentensis]